jgi:hypothetical protein
MALIYLNSEDRQLNRAATDQSSTCDFTINFYRNDNLKNVKEISLEYVSFYNLFYNISANLNNNTFYIGSSYGNNTIITLPDGMYTCPQIAALFNKALSDYCTMISWAGPANFTALSFSFDSTINKFTWTNSQLIDIWIFWNDNHSSTFWEGSYNFCNCLGLVDYGLSPANYLNSSATFGNHGVATNYRYYFGRSSSGTFPNYPKFAINEVFISISPVGGNIRNIATGNSATFLVPVTVNMGELAVWTSKEFPQKKKLEVMNLDQISVKLLNNRGQQLSNGYNNISMIFKV